MLPAYCQFFSKGFSFAEERGAIPCVFYAEIGA